MKKLWIVAGALCLAGCSPKPDSAPQTTAATPVVPPQIVATIAPPVVVAPQFPTATPPAPDVSSLSPPGANAMQPAVGEDARETTEEKQQKVASLRSDIDRLQNQRRAVEEQKQQFGTRNPNADANERALGADSLNNARMAQYNSQLDTIDSQIADRQKQIDDLMLSR